MIIQKILQKVLDVKDQQLIVTENYFVLNTYIFVFFLEI